MMYAQEIEASPSEISSKATASELTIRSLVLGTILTIILAAANAYLGLKLGTTISASIPAAVISMGVLRFFRNANILENNMVQTMASVGEALTAGVTFILPALVIMGAWSGFNYWLTVVTSLLGGFLGVLFTIPLRRALLKDKTLRYPEGVAIGNVLMAGDAREADDLRYLIKGGFVGSIITLFQSGFQILTDSFSWWVKTTTGVFGFGLGLSPALIAAGYIVGVNVALSLLLGIFIGWLAGVPILSFFYSVPVEMSAADAAVMMWKQHIRYIGVGVMLVGGMWTLLNLSRSVMTSILMSLASLRKVKLGADNSVARVDSDIPINYVIYAILGLLIPIFLLIGYGVLSGVNGLPSSTRHIIAGFSTLYILVAGFIFCSISAYFAGLIGSTNNPVSGLLVSVLLLLCLSLMAIANIFGFGEDLSNILAIVAIGSAVVIASGLSISNDTMQDLKVGAMIGATPWMQQVMLFLGAIVSAFVIAPILQLLYQAYGIGGVFPRPNMDPAQMLAAPQAGLMAAITKGAFSHQLPWLMISIGAVVAVLCIILDETLKRRYATRCPVLAVGVGIYLPLSASVPCVIGGLLSYLAQRRLLNQDMNRIQAHRHRGLLLTCGMVAGASIMGVLLAIPFALKESSDILRIMPDSLMSISGILSVVVTAILCWWVYRVVVYVD